MTGAVIFDFDGLIIDTEHCEYLSWAEIWAEQGCSLRPADWRPHVGSVGTFDPIAALQAASDRSLDVELIRARQGARNLELSMSAPSRPGIREALTLCGNQGLRCAVASSSPEKWVRTHLDRLGLAASFEYLACLDAGVRPKPAPDLYRRALRVLGVPAAHAIAVEDSLHGLAAARGANIRCIVMPGAMTAGECFRGAHCAIASDSTLTLGAAITRCLSQGSVTWCRA